MQLEKVSDVVGIIKCLTYSFVLSYVLIIFANFYLLV